MNETTTTTTRVAVDQILVAVAAQRTWFNRSCGTLRECEGCEGGEDGEGAMTGRMSMLLL